VRTLSVGRLRLDLSARAASFNDQPIALTTAEFDLLHALARRAGHVLSREQLLEMVMGNAELAFDRAVDTQVSRLRQKLAAVGGDALIRTVRGVGYMLSGAPK
jgi:two-component system OmpR family response regulator